jgi:hypothetical protein
LQQEEANSSGRAVFGGGKLQFKFAGSRNTLITLHYQLEGNATYFGDLT